MPSITNDDREGATRLQKEFPAIDPVDDRVERGFQILIEFVSLVEQPVDLEEERCALLAVLAIHQESLLTERGRILHAELDRCVQLVQRRQAQNLIDWIAVPDRGLACYRPSVRARHRRLLLLFFLLAKTVGRVNECPIPDVLQNMTPLAWAERLDRDLVWLPRLLGSRRYFLVADLYLEATQRILFEHLLIEPHGIATSEFMTWPWFRQVLHLRGWRRIWALNQSTNPAMIAERLEFRLARAGAYRQLLRHGGVIAYRALADLGYRDLPRHDRNWPRARVLLAVTLAVACVGGGWLVENASRNLALQSNLVQARVGACLSGESDHD